MSEGAVERPRAGVPEVAAASFERQNRRNTKRSIGEKGKQSCA